MMCVYYYVQYLTQYLIILSGFWPGSCRCTIHLGSRDQAELFNFGLSANFQMFGSISCDQPLYLDAAIRKTAAKLFLPSDIVGGNCRQGNYIEDGLKLSELK